MGGTTEARVSGPLQPLVRGFLVELIELDYGMGAADSAAAVDGGVERVDGGGGIEPTQLTAPLIYEFLALYRARGPRRGWLSAASERELVAYLRRLGLVPESEVPAVSDPLELLVASFVEYLVCERGLAVDSTSVYEYKRTARAFWPAHIAPDGELTASDVTAFVLRGAGGARSRSPPPGPSSRRPPRP